MDRYESLKTTTLPHSIASFAIKRRRIIAILNADDEIVSSWAEDCARTRFSSAWPEN